MGKVLRIPGRKIIKKNIEGANVLLVRSVTPVTTDLLCGTSVRFVGSMTSGKEHIDMAALEKLGIRVVCAEGCNANAVVDYVLSALCWFNRKKKVVIQQKEKHKNRN